MSESIDIHEQFKECCGNGDLAKAVEIYDECVAIDVEEDNCIALQDAIINHHFNIVNWLLMAIDPNIFKEVLSEIWLKCCVTNNKDAILWITNTYPFTDVKEGFEVLCEHGHLETCKLLRSIYPDLYIEVTMFNVSHKNNHIDLCKWLVNVAANKLQLFMATCYNGDIDLYNWMNTNYDEITNLLPDRGFKKACVHGHLALAKQIYDAEPIHGHNYFDIFSQTWKAGNIDVVIWLQTIYHMEIDLTLIVNAITHRNVDMCAWLYIEKPELFDRVNYDHIFNTNNMYISDKFYDMLRWLYETFPNVTVHLSSRIFWCTMRTPGQFENAKWLYNIKNDVLTMKLNEIMLSLNKGIDCKRWLLDKLDKATLDNVFEHWMLNEQYGNCLWLRNLYSNITVSNKLFKLMCKTNHTMCHWLCEWNPRFSIERRENDVIRPIIAKIEKID